MVRTVAAALGREVVVFQEIEDGDAALVLDLGIAADDRALVERQVDDLVAVVSRRFGHRA